MILGHLLIPLLHNFPHPVCEGIANHGVANVHNVLLRHLLHLFLLCWQPVHHLLNALDLVVYGVQVEAFILGNMEVLDVGALDELLPSADDVAHVIDRDVLIGRQIRTDIKAEEGPDLPLRLVLGREAGSGDLLISCRIDLLLDWLLLARHILRLRYFKLL